MLGSSVNVQCPLRAFQLNTSLVFNLCLELTLKMVATTTTHQMPNVLFHLLSHSVLFWLITFCIVLCPSRQAGYGHQAHAVGGRDGQGHQPTAVVSNYLSYYDFVIWERIQLLIPAWQQQGHPHTVLVVRLLQKAHSGVRLDYRDTHTDSQLGGDIPFTNILTTCL